MWFVFISFLYHISCVVWLSCYFLICVFFLKKCFVLVGYPKACFVLVGSFIFKCCFRRPEAFNHGWGRRPIQPMSPRMPPGACMPDSHNVPRPKASNHRGAAGRCNWELACLILIVLICPRPATSACVGGRCGHRSFLWGILGFISCIPSGPSFGWVHWSSRSRFRNNLNR